MKRRMFSCSVKGSRFKRGKMKTDENMTDSNDCFLSPPRYDDLTSLTCLQNINNLPVPDPPTLTTITKPTGKKANRIRLLKEHKLLEYRTSKKDRPPYSYANLIYMAMRANKNKMRLRSIYDWIREKFLYYRNADPAWQKSIRNSLSCCRCFMKVPRPKNEPGKGGFWRLDPVFSEPLDNGEKVYQFRKHRNTTKTPKQTKQGENYQQKTQNKMNDGEAVSKLSTTPPCTLPGQSGRQMQPAQSSSPPIPIQHSCDDPTCMENRHELYNQVVAQELELQLQIPNPTQQDQFIPQLTAETEQQSHLQLTNPYRPDLCAVVNSNNNQHNQNTGNTGLAAVSSASSPLATSTAPFSPSTAVATNHDARNIPLLQNIHMVDVASVAASESTNTQQTNAKTPITASYIGLNHVEKNYGPNGTCVCVLCTLATDTPPDPSNLNEILNSLGHSVHGGPVKGPLAIEIPDFDVNNTTITTSVAPATVTNVNVSLVATPGEYSMPQYIKSKITTVGLTENRLPITLSSVVPTFHPVNGESSGTLSAKDSAVLAASSGKEVITMSDLSNIPIFTEQECKQYSIQLNNVAGNNNEQFGNTLASILGTQIHLVCPSTLGQELTTLAWDERNGISILGNELDLEELMNIYDLV